MVRCYGVQVRAEGRDVASDRREPSAQHRKEFS